MNEYKFLLDNLPNIRNDKNINIINRNNNYDYCFIYGGANDMYGSVKAIKAVKNIQGIVDICNQNDVEAIVVTGFNPFDCVVTPNNPGYPKRYADFQQMLLDSIKGAKVIDTRKAVIRKDCGDAICHMNHSGHKKMAETIINKMNLKTLLSSNICRWMHNHLLIYIHYELIFHN